MSGRNYQIGESAQRSKTITTMDIERFAELTGDHNPIHLDESYAKETYFKGKIAHGMLAVSLISAVLGNDLPGPGSIYLGQEVKFLAPVRPGDTIKARVEVIAWDPERGRIQLITEVYNQNGEKVISGVARLVLAVSL